jgi:hypothetical protein
MFKCDVCKKSSRHGETMTLVPESEPCTHPERRDGATLLDRGGNGTRIVREAKRCPRCAA